jgi:hypothetical protein
LKREPSRSRVKIDFIKLKYHRVVNEAIEYLLHYKYFILAVAPFDLNLDGNFCDETYKYLLDIFHVAAKFTSNESRQ